MSLNSMKCPSPIPIIGRAAPLQRIKILKNYSCTPDKVSTNFHRAHKPEVCADFVNGQNIFKKLCYPQQADKIERLNRTEAFKLSPVKPLSFVCMGSVCFDPSANQDTKAIPVAIVGPRESWRGWLFCDPPRHPPGVWTNQLPPLSADNEFQVGNQACKPANLKLIGCQCDSFLKSGVTDSTVACKPAVRKPGFTSEGSGVALLSNTLPFGSTSGRHHRQCVGMSCRPATGSSELVCCRIRLRSIFEEQGRTTATKNKEGTYSRQRKNVRGRWSLRSAEAEKEFIEDLSNAAPPPAPLPFTCYLDPEASLF